MSELEINLNLLSIYTCSDITAIPFMGKSKASYKIPLVFNLSFINDSHKHHHKIIAAQLCKNLSVLLNRNTYEILFLSTHVCIGTKSQYCMLQHEGHMFTKYHGFQFSVMRLQVVI